MRSQPAKAVPHSRKRVTANYPYDRTGIAAEGCRAAVSV